MPEISHRDSFGAVESVKAASDVYMPVTGEIVEVNNVRIAKRNFFEGMFLIVIFFFHAVVGDCTRDR